MEEMNLNLNYTSVKFCAACRHFTRPRKVWTTTNGEKIVSVERGECHCPKTGKNVRENDGFGCWDYQEV